VCYTFVYSNKVRHLNMIFRNCCLVCSRWGDASCRRLETLLGCDIWKTDNSNCRIHRCVVKFGRPVVPFRILTRNELHELLVLWTLFQIIWDIIPWRIANLDWRFEVLWCRYVDGFIKPDWWCCFINSYCLDN